MKKSLFILSGVIVIGTVVFSGIRFLHLDKTENPPLSPINTQKEDFFTFKLAGSGMEPNYHDKSSCILDRDLYKNSDPMRGDVILFNGFTSAGAPSQFVKRIITIPDEEIIIANNLVYINNSLLSEPYLAPETKTLVFDSTFMTENTEITTPVDSYFVLGDNRQNSLDSREFGFVKRKDIVGKVVSCK